jgi:nucleotide-binding universal stress UspA family protein
MEFTIIRVEEYRNKRLDVSREAGTFNSSANIEKMAKDYDIDCSIVVVESYQPDKTIIDEAWKQKADVIIMGRHGKRGLFKLLVGSMTSRIIGYGFPKVLIVPKYFVYPRRKNTACHRWFCAQQAGNP